jgi:hypothetical protein
MSLLRSIWLGYFAIHIPISMLIDFQAILPKSWYPPGLTWLVDEWYFDNFGDFLMKNPPVWFQSLVWAELILQMPFFCYALLALYNRWPSFRWSAFAYATHLLTVMIPILSEVALSDIADTFKLRLYLIYGLWVAMPFWIFVYTALWDPCAVPSSPRLKSA